VKHISNCSYFIWSQTGSFRFVTVKYSLHLRLFMAESLKFPRT